MQKGQNHIKVKNIFGACCREILPDLDAHETMEVVLEHFAVDEILEALREHCYNLSQEPGDTWHVTADGLEGVLSGELE